MRKKKQHQKGVYERAVFQSAPIPKTCLNLEQILAQKHQMQGREEFEDSEPLVPNP